MERPTRILIADSSPLFRLGVKLMLRDRPQRRMLLEAGTWDEASRFVRHYEPGGAGEGIDLVLLDRGLPGLPDFEALRPTLRRLPVLIMAEGAEASFVHRTYRHGARGLIDKGADGTTFIAAIGALLGGRTWQRPDPATDAEPPAIDLSHKQRLVLKGLRQGMSNKQIAADLGLTENTVKYHLTNIYRKFDLEKPCRIQLLRHSLNEPATSRAWPSY